MQPSPGTGIAFAEERLAGAGRGGAAPPAGMQKRWWILVLLALGIMISFVDRTSISSALVVPSFKAQFALSDIDRGWISSAFFWSYALLQVPMGLAVDRFGVKRPYAICFFIWCAATAATGLMTTLTGLILIRLIVGAAEAVVAPASFRWIRNNFKERQNGTAIGIYMVGTKIGPAIGAPLAAWLIISFDWRAMFLMAGAAGLVWLIPWLLMVRRDVPPRAVPGEIRHRSSLSMRALFASPVIWGTLIVNFCYNYFTFYCMTWMPAYLVEQRGLKLQQMGLYSFFSFAGISIVALGAGWAADQLIKRGGNPVFVRKAFTIAGFLVASTVVLGAFARSLDVALFWNVASLSGLGLATANNLALCRLTLIPAPAIGLVTGFQQIATALAGIVAPILTGWLVHVSGGYIVPVEAIFVFLIIGALSCLLLLRPEWVPRLIDGRG